MKNFILSDRWYNATLAVLVLMGVIACIFGLLGQTILVGITFLIGIVLLILIGLAWLLAQRMKKRLKI